MLVHDFGVGWKFDLLHQHAGSRRARSGEGCAPCLPAAASAAWIDHVRSGRQGELERRQYGPGPGRIVAVSRMVKTQLARDYAVDPARIEVV